MKIQKDEVFILNTNVRRGAYAIISGSAAYPNLKGRVMFRETPRGVVVSVTVSGLPYADGNCAGTFLGFHIHEGVSCSGNETDPFADTGSHYSPNGCTHPYHAGDMPPLLNAGGYASMSFLTDRFTVSQIIGKTVVIHSGPDDFTSQPAGNSGIKIVCGVIKY